ncbi:MAG: hypothetical protein JWL77_4178 [Chthonomonadaceae bacterium]|nr:hypothetical protein [Chthonomonadaceae bacterium]
MRINVLLGLVILSLLSVQGKADTTITLRNSFVEKYHERVSMDVTYLLVAGQTNPHDPSNDGEVHMSGTATDATDNTNVGFAIVAEIWRAQKYGGRAGLLQWIADQANRNPVPMRGVWRIWAEHGAGTFRQGDPQIPSTWSPITNPNHVFELHPLLGVTLGTQSFSFLNDMTFLAGFDALNDAARTRGAFGYFERMICTVTPGPQTTTIAGSNHKFNFVQFKARLREAPTPNPSGDGIMVLADIVDQNGQGETATTPLASNVRLVFPAGTTAAATIQTLSVGASLKLVGFPRMNLTTVRTVIQSGHRFQGKFPYEIVVQTLGN